MTPTKTSKVLSSVFVVISLFLTAIIPWPALIVLALPLGASSLFAYFAFTNRITKW